MAQVDHFDAIDPHGTISASADNVSSEPTAPCFKVRSMRNKTMESLFLAIKRHWRVLSGALVLVIILVLASSSGPGITEANSRRIKDGMSLQQVEAILGGAAGDYYSSSFFDRPRVSGVMGIVGDYKDWSGNKGVVVVGFDAEGRVRSARFFAGRRLLPWEVVRRWLGI